MLFRSPRQRRGCVAPRAARRHPPKVEGYDDEERTAHVHESGTDRHNAPRPAVRTARVEHHIEAPSRRSRSANLLKLLSASVVAVFLAVPYWKGKYFSKPVKKAKEDAKNA